MRDAIVSLVCGLAIGLSIAAFILEPLFFAKEEKKELHKEKLKHMCNFCANKECTHRDNMTDKEISLGIAQYCNHGFTRNY